MKGNKKTRNSLLFVASSLIDKSVTFISIPLLTSALSKEEYGLVANLNIVITILFLVSSGSILAANSRFYKECKSIQEHTSNVFMVVVCGSILNLIVGIVLINIMEVEPFFLTLVFGVLLFGTYEFCLQQLVMEEKGQVYLKAAIIRVFIFVIALVVLNKTSALNLFSYIVLFCFSYCLPIIYLIYAKHCKIGRPSNIDLTQIKNYLKYSLKILPHNIASLINQYLDRLMVVALIGLAGLGVYALAAQLSAMIGLLNNALNKAFLPKTLDSFKERNFKELNYLSIIYILPISFFSALLSLFSFEIIMFMGGKEYIKAEVPFIILCSYFVLLGCYLRLCGSLYYFESATKYLPFVSISVVIFNLVFGYGLFQIVGVIGIAAATYLSQLLVLLFVTYLNNKVCALRFDLKRHIILALLPIVFGFAGLLVSSFFTKLFVMCGLIMAVLGLYRSIRWMDNCS